MTAAFDSLRGLALGDCFGETFFFREWERSVPEGPWRWTDDTAMALSLYRLLVRRGEVVQDELARLFATEYEADPYRNYGPAMHDVLQAIADGEPWQEVTRRQFDGQGSWGNGAAMRVAPLGAWFATDLDEVVRQAGLSAAVTHAHAEASAGAVAVAVATALAVRGIGGHQLIEVTLASVPQSEVEVRLRLVSRCPSSTDPMAVATEVGCGRLISAQDTVPFAIWCAARHLDDLPEALWTTASAGGDVDTTCAIVGGIVAARAGLSLVPADWLRACEPLPEVGQSR
jgi:ADP-ribosylglycohydrolase